MISRRLVGGFRGGISGHYQEVSLVIARRLVEVISRRLVG